DVVVFYFKGGEAFTEKDGHLFRSGGGRRAVRVVSFTRLVSLFADTPGAHVLLFDVDREAARRGADADRVSRWDDFQRDVRHHVAVLRYAWLGGRRGPSDPDLVRTLQAVLPRSSQLKEVARQVREIASATKKEGKELRFESRVPTTGMEDLRFGARE